MYNESGTYDAIIDLRLRTTCNSIVVKDLDSFLTNYWDFVVQILSVYEDTDWIKLKVRAMRPFQNQETYVHYIRDFFLPALKLRINFAVTQHFSGTILEWDSNFGFSCKNLSYNLNMPLEKVLPSGPVEQYVVVSGDFNYVNGPGPGANR